MALKQYPAPVRIHRRIVQKRERMRWATSHEDEYQSTADQSSLEWWVHGDSTHVSNHGGGDVLRDIEAHKPCDVEAQEVVCKSHRRVKDC